MSIQPWPSTQSTWSSIIDDRPRTSIVRSALCSRFQSPSYFDKGKVWKKFPTQKKRPERITRQSTPIKGTQDKRRSEKIFLFKLRCYCCQNCNFRNEFQVSRATRALNTTTKCPSEWKISLMKNLFHSAKEIYFVFSQSSSGSRVKCSRMKWKKRKMCNKV